MILGVTHWRGLTDPVGIRRELEWGELCAGLTRCAGKPHAGRGWSPGTFRGDHRALADVELTFAVGLDLDRGTCHVEDAAAPWDGSLAYLHSTKSHSDEHPRIRVILPLSRPVDAAEYRRCWRWARRRMADAGHEVDRATSDPSRLWFLPCLPTNGDDPELLQTWGRSLDVAQALTEEPEELRTAPALVDLPPVDDRDRAVRRARAYLDRMGPAISGSGGHTHTFRAAQSLKGFGLDEGTALSMLADWNRSCVPPWSDRDLARKVSEAYHHGHAIAPGELLRKGAA